MKKILMFVVLAAFLAPATVFAQARCSNKTGKVITLKSVDKTSEQVIYPNKRVNVQFAPPAGDFKFTLYYYEGMNEKTAGMVSKTIKGGDFEITADDLAGRSAATPDISAPAEQKLRAPAAYGAKPTTSLILVDSSDYRIEALGGIFDGVALAPGQETSNSFNVETGQLEITFKHDVVKDNEDAPHGRKYRQSVWSGIIVQDQERLVIKNENLTEITGDQFVTFAKSELPFKIVFTSGPWKGKALRKNGFTEKRPVSEGFNSLAIQFVGEDGLKYQADIEVIIVPKEKPIIFRTGDLKNKRVIKQ